MRDTDRDWNEIAHRAPYYGVVSQDKFLNPDKEALEEFFRTGREYVEQELAYIRSTWPEFAPERILDFGCGVGRLLIPMASRFGSAVGVDIAEGMRQLALSHAQAAGATIEVFEDVPEGREFDWVNSFIVLQHIPPARGYAILAKLWNATASGGVFAVQVTTWKDSAMQGEIARELGAFRYDGETVVVYDASKIGPGHLSMFDYDLSRIFSLLDLPHGHRIVLKKTNHGGCHGFHIYARKS